MAQHLPSTSTALPVDRTTALYERPVLVADDTQAFQTVRAGIERSFAPAQVEGFLKSLRSARLRIRDFEDVLGKGKLGSAAAATYARLSPGDQGQIREFYLASLEQVPLALRDRYFQLYAYY